MADIGTLMAENDSDHERRPVFYTCEECGRKFTKLALEVHKKSCSEDENCSCKVCKSSNLNHLETKTGKCVSNPETSAEKLENNFREPFRDLKVSSSQNIQNSSDHENAKVKLPTSNTVINNHSHSTEPLFAEGTEISPSEKDQERTVLTDSLESCHNGEPCNRKLFCIFCEKHVLWISFGYHALTHCSKNENNDITCLACNETRSSTVLFLMHFHAHTMSHPVCCADCICSHPRCIEIMTRQPLKNAPDNLCYICQKSYLDFCLLITHMEQHIKTITKSLLLRQINNIQYYTTSPQGDGSIICSKCYKSFADLATLFNHVCVNSPIYLMFV
ncbi:zinc finger protein 85 [Nephila pilipes]|uniref:Zinc finger protein 85 n=1 Tax=Nephila pilipes TaxID=299642 RepID=A0A8X6MLD6_NEPPI|nr:zinc finger protein 85 [Nephila pilipes]